VPLLPGLRLWGTLPEGEAGADAGGGDEVAEKTQEEEIGREGEEEDRQEEAAEEAVAEAAAGIEGEDLWAGMRRRRRR